MLKALASQPVGVKCMYILEFVTITSQKEMGHQL